MLCDKKKLGPNVDFEVSEGWAPETLTILLKSAILANL